MAAAARAVATPGHQLTPSMILDRRPSSAVTRSKIIKTSRRKQPRIIGASSVPRPGVNETQPERAAGPDDPELRDRAFR
jgi:hypothetical protein